MTRPALLAALLLAATPAHAQDAAPGIAGALIRLVETLDASVTLLITTVAVIVGLFFLFSAISRLARSGGPGAPSTSGTVLRFLAAIASISFLDLMDLAGTTAFGGADRQPTLSWSGPASADYDRLIRAVLRIVQLVGALALLRGIAMLKDIPEGRNGASAGRTAAHMIGGLAAWHIAAVIAAVQTTLGITVLNVN